MAKYHEFEDLTYEEFDQLEDWFEWMVIQDPFTGLLWQNDEVMGEVATRVYWEITTKGSNTPIPTDLIREVLGEGE